MELDNLKSAWQHAGGHRKNENELNQMTKLVNHPSLKRIKTKLIVETIALTFFLIVYYDWFDGYKKSFFANAVLVIGLSLYIINDIVGYVSIARPVWGSDLKASIRNYVARLKRFAILSLFVSVLYSVSLTVYFTSVINFTKEKRLILAGIVVVLLVLFRISFKKWNQRIKALEHQAQEFSYDEKDDSYKKRY